jgi:hypothetical protein
MNRDAGRIPGPCERGRVTAIVDVRDLSRRESNDIKLRVIPVHAVEKMEVTTSGSHDNDLVAHGGLLRNSNRLKMLRGVRSRADKNLYVADSSR